jgi:heme exporter protein C
MHWLANPGVFGRLARAAYPIALAGMLLCFAFGGYIALITSPPDYQQGEMVRIMYVHVPAAWGAVMIYTAIALASASYLIWKHPLADLIARASAPVGAVFAFLTLVTGALWGKPTWGAWWVWDARLTSMLILFFLYIGYITLASAMRPGERANKMLAVLSLVGFVNIPIIKFSVEWNTLHQPASLLREGGVAVDPVMLTPLLLMMAGVIFFTIATVILRVQAMLLEQKARRLRFHRESSITAAL